ncbi:MAG: hypothetical protein IKW90_12530 [Lachnospiraceae bacterium]|nr:hypothetical protein [Lachnospiraceae bacterium]
MKLTKSVNIFNQEQREIRCIAREHDYLGDGTTFVEEDLEVGRLYTFIHGRAESYGEMVFLKEVPSRFGFQSYLFEELKAYDEEEFKLKSREWFWDKIDKSLEDVKNGRVHSAEDLDKVVEELLRHEDFKPYFTEGHDPGAAYWIYPVKVEDADRIENIKEFMELEISIPDNYFDWLLTDFFVDGIDPDLSINSHRYSTDYVPEGVPIYGFAWDLHPNFYTKEDFENILQRMEETAVVLRSGQIDQLPHRQKEHLRKTFAMVAEDESEMTYKDAMVITAKFYDAIVLRLRRMITESLETDKFCVTAP